MWHPSVMMRRTAWAAVGGYRNIGDAEDYDLWLRISERFQLANLEAVLLKYRLHPAQASVARCKSQALSWAVARAAANIRRCGQPDPLDSVAEITPEALIRQPAVLAKLGVSPSIQQTTFARSYLGAIRNMCEAGQRPLVVEAIEETLRSSEFRYAETWAVADLRFFAGKVYWQEGKRCRSILSVARALVARPVVLARPLKPLLSWLRPAEI